MFLYDKSDIYFCKETLIEKNLDKAKVFKGTVVNLRLRQHFLYETIDCLFLKKKIYAIKKMISFKTKKKKIRKTFKEFRHFFQSVDFIQGVT